jgi:alkylhydroperoxidase family enzyme
VPETVDTYAVLNKSLWTNDHVRPAIVEMVRLRNARTVNCVFCKSVRYDVAKADGLSEDKVDHIANGYEDSDLSDVEKTALAFTDAYLFDPKGVTPALKARLEATFNKAEIATLAVALATFNASSRCAVSLGGMPESLPVSEISVPE